MKNIFQKLDDLMEGRKTYLFLLGLIVFGFADMKGFVPPELAPYKTEIYFGLLAGAGISLRKGMASEGKKVREEIRKTKKGGGE